MLNDDTGTATAVTMKWDATGTWRNNADATLGGNNKLMKGYEDSNGAVLDAFNGVFGGNGDKPTILITGLDAWMTADGLTGYAVVIYSDGDIRQRPHRRILARRHRPRQPGEWGSRPRRRPHRHVQIIDNSNWGTNTTFVEVTGPVPGVGNYTSSPRASPPTRSMSARRK